MTMAYMVTRGSDRQVVCGCAEPGHGQPIAEDGFALIACPGIVDSSGRSPVGGWPVRCGCYRATDDRLRCSAPGPANFSRHSQRIGLDPVERFFALITDEAIRRGSFPGLEGLVREIDRFITHYNRNCRLFVWTATADSIIKKLQRLLVAVQGDDTRKAQQKAREVAGLSEVLVRDLRPPCGMRLGTAGLSFEDRPDLLGYHAGRVTTHYSRAGTAHLMACVEKPCDVESKPGIALIRRLGKFRQKLCCREKRTLRR
jgi:hypothetical protein